MDNENYKGEDKAERKSNPNSKGQIEGNIDVQAGGDW